MSMYYFKYIQVRPIAVHIPGITVMGEQNLAKSRTGLKIKVIFALARLLK